MNNNRGKLIGLDIGGTKIEGILWDGRRIILSEKIKTPKNRWTFLREIIELIHRMGPLSKVRGIGIAMAGAIDLKRETVMNSPNLKFLNNFAFAKYLRKKIKKPVCLDNDTHCFLLAESRLGSTKGYKHIVALTLGTGVGGGIMIDRKLFRGKDGAAGEFGKMMIAKEDKGRFLNLEALVSSHGFHRLGLKDPLKIQEQAFAGNKKAIQIYKKIGKYLGIALANIVNIFNPEIIVIGGGISRSGRLILTPAIHEMKNHTLIPVSRYPIIKISKLKHAGALGAVSLFFE